MSEQENSRKAAIIEVGGKQHLVFPGTQATVEKLPNQVGETVKVKDILTSAELSLKVVAHKLGPKINGLKFKNKVRYLRRYGHRQQLTILELLGTEVKKTESVKAETKEPKTVAKTAPKKVTKTKETAKPVKKSDGKK